MTGAVGEDRRTRRQRQLERLRRVRPIDFDRVNRAALAVLPGLLRRWLPGGRTEGAEYVALNPRRVDHHPGSFRVNTRTGRWADFAVEGVSGGDVVSLAAYLGSIGQVDAADRLGAMLGVEVRDGK
jgi:hypothetical protein